MIIAKVSNIEIIPAGLKQTIFSLEIATSYADVFVVFELTWIRSYTRLG